MVGREEEILSGQRRVGNGEESRCPNLCVSWGGRSKTWEVDIKEGVFPSSAVRDWKGLRWCFVQNRVLLEKDGLVSLGEFFY